MKIFRWMSGLAALCLLGAGCTSATPPSDAGVPTVAPAPSSPHTAGVVAAPDNEAPPAPPEGALYTIYCAQFVGPTHAIDALRAKAVLQQATHMKSWYVITGEDASTLYYGYYKTFDDPKQPQERARAQADRLRINYMADLNHRKLFGACPFVELASPDPLAPPEWDLRNAKGYYSLEVGVYKDSPDRKRAAVDAVRQARSQGVDAYYYHGPTMSSVCVGHWPKEAIKEPEVQNTNADDTLAVLPYALDPDKAASFITNNAGQRVVPVVPKMEILDPTVQEMMDKYPVHAINGDTVIMKAKDKDGKEYSAEAPSFLVKIPHEDENPNIDDAPVLAPNVDADVAGQAEPPSDTGRLKSIDP
jgi:hypothetical protein